MARTQPPPVFRRRCVPRSKTADGQQPEWSSNKNQQHPATSPVSTPCYPVPKSTLAITGGLSPVPKPLDCSHISVPSTAGSPSVTLAYDRGNPVSSAIAPSPEHVPRLPNSSFLSNCYTDGSLYTTDIAVDTDTGNSVFDLPHSDGARSTDCTSQDGHKLASPVGDLTPFSPGLTDRSTTDDLGPRTVSGILNTLDRHILGDTAHGASTSSLSRSRSYQTAYSPTTPTAACLNRGNSDSNPIRTHSLLRHETQLPRSLYSLKSLAERAAAPPQKNSDDIFLYRSDSLQECIGKRHVTQYQVPPSPPLRSCRVSPSASLSTSYPETRNTCRLTPPSYRRHLSSETSSPSSRQITDFASQNVDATRPKSANKLVGHDYEALIKAQQTETEAVLRQRDQEVRALRSQLEETRNVLTGTLKDPSLPLLLQRKETEMNLLFDAKNQEVEALRRRLRASENIRRQLQTTVHSKQLKQRDTQVADEINTLKRHLDHAEQQRRQAETVAAERQKQYQNILKDLAVSEGLIEWYKQCCPDDPALHDSVCKTASQLDYLESEAARMRKIIDDLSFEKQELQQLLIQKEKQLTLLSEVDPSSPETSAIHLGVKAIAMAREATNYREKICDLEADIKNTQEELCKTRTLLEDTVQKLTEKRHEATTLVETLAAKDMRIARLETLMHHHDAEQNRQREEQRLAFMREKEKAGRLEGEIQIAMQQQTRLREELARRDDTILTLKSEVIRQSKYNQNAETRLDALTAELTEAQQALDIATQQSIEKDKCLHELEQRLKQKNLQFQESCLSDFVKSRQLKLSMRLQEDEALQTLQLRDAQISRLRSSLASSTQQVTAVKNALLQAEPTFPEQPAKSRIQPAFNTAQNTKVKQGVSERSTSAATIPCTPSTSVRSLTPKKQCSGDQPLPRASPVGRRGICGTSSLGNSRVSRVSSPTSYTAP